jgi:hypothetical protein
METALLRSSLRSVLTNRTLWAFTILFMLFWLVIGAFGMSQDTPRTVDSEIAVTSSWFSIVTLFVLSFVAMNMARTVNYAGPSLAYGFRYTKLRPRSYMLALVACSAVLGVLMVILTLVLTSGMFSANFGYGLLPNDPLGAVALAAVSGVFMMTLAMLLVLFAVNYLGLRSVILIMFLPLIIVVGLENLQASGALPAAVVYASPFNAILSLLYQAFSSSPVYAGLYDTATEPLQWELLLISVLLWTALLLGIDLFLLRRLRPRSAEEERQL